MDCVDARFVIELIDNTILFIVGGLSLIEHPPFYRVHSGLFEGVFDSRPVSVHSS